MYFFIIDICSGLHTGQISSTHGLFRRKQKKKIKSNRIVHKGNVTWHEIMWQIHPF